MVTKSLQTFYNENVCVYVEDIGAKIAFHRSGEQETRLEKTRSTKRSSKIKADITNRNMNSLKAMMKNKMITGLFILIMISHFTSCAQTKDLHNRLTAYHRIDMATMNQQILDLINQHRRSIGKGNLQMTDVATVQATQHSRDMMRGATPFGHEGFDSRVNAVRNSIGFINAAAENVAYGQMSAEEVVDGWLHSPGHKKNIEGDYNLTGIGVSQNGDGVIYFTQLFVLKK